MTISY